MLIEQAGGDALFEPEPVRMPCPVALPGAGPLKLPRLGQALEDLLQVISRRKAPGDRTDLGDDFIAICHEEGFSRPYRPQIFRQLGLQFLYSPRLHVAKVAPSSH